MGAPPGVYRVRLDHPIDVSHGDSFIAQSGPSAVQQAWKVCWDRGRQTRSVFQKSYRGGILPRSDNQTCQPFRYLYCGGKRDSHRMHSRSFGSPF